MALERLRDYSLSLLRAKKKKQVKLIDLAAVQWLFSLLMICAIVQIQVIQGQ